MGRVGTMKFKLITPEWGHPWRYLYPRLLKERGHKEVLEGADVILHMWANTGDFDPNARNIVFMRRYEFFDPKWREFDWSLVSDLILVNSWIKGKVDEFFNQYGIKTKTHLIYNAFDPDRWTYAERGHGNKVGMVCHVHQKKNIQLALQILAEMPGTELHVAGQIQDLCIVEYLRELGNKLGVKGYFYNYIPNDRLDKWWDGMNYCLSTSLSEGNPNNVIEAMAKGIKPIVHNWPGAEEQFGKYVFNTVSEAVSMMQDDYCSAEIREHAESYFSIANYHKVVDLVESTTKEK